MIPAAAPYRRPPRPGREGPRDGGGGGSLPSFRLQQPEPALAAAATTAPTPPRERAAVRAGKGRSDMDPELLARRRAQDARYRAGKTAEQRAARQAYMREYLLRRKAAEKASEQQQQQQQQQQQVAAALAGILRLAGPAEPPAPGSPPREGRGGVPTEDERGGEDSAAPPRRLGRLYKPRSELAPQRLARERARDADKRERQTDQQRAARAAYMLAYYERRRRSAERAPPPPPPDGATPPNGSRQGEDARRAAAAALGGQPVAAAPAALDRENRQHWGHDLVGAPQDSRRSDLREAPALEMGRQGAARPNDTAEGGGRGAVAVDDRDSYQRAHAEACRQARLLHARSAGSSGPADDDAAAAAARDAYVRAYMQGYARALAGPRASAGRRGDDDDGAGGPARRENPAGRGVEAPAREADGARRDGRIRQQHQQLDETTPKELVAPQRENQATQAGDSLRARQAPGRKRGRPRKVDQQGENGQPYEATPCAYLAEEERLARNERQRLYRAGLTEEQRLAQALTGRARKRLVRAKLAEERERARSGEADASLALGVELAEEDGLARGKKRRLRESDRDNLTEEERLTRNERQRLCRANLTEEQKMAQGKGLFSANQPAEKGEVHLAQSQTRRQANRAEGEVPEPDASTTVGIAPGASPQRSPPPASGNILDAVFAEFVTHCRREREAKRAAQPGPDPDPGVPQNRQPKHVEEQGRLHAADFSADRPGASQTQRLECALSQVKRRLQLLKQQVHGLGLPPPPPPQQRQQRPLLLFPPLDDSDGDCDDCVCYDDDEDDDDDDDETDATCDVAEDEDILTE